jgi:hypothetical protein
MTFSTRLLPNAAALTQRASRGQAHDILFAGGDAANAADVPPEHLFQDGAGDVRWEIDDSAASLNISPTDWPSGEIRTLGDILNHDKLYEAYPEVRDLPVGLLPALNEGFYGAYGADGRAFADYAEFLENPGRLRDEEYLGAMVINPTLHQYTEDSFLNGETLERRTDGDNELLQTVIHELQHFIDSSEGFQMRNRAPYEKRPTEVMAHLVEDRIHLSPEERYADPHAIGEQVREAGIWSPQRPPRPEDPGWFSGLFGAERPISNEDLHTLMMEQARTR